MDRRGAPDPQRMRQPFWKCVDGGVDGLVKGVSEKIAARLWLNTYVLAQVFLLEFVA
jgi:hypothetical protein